MKIPPSKSFQVYFVLSQARRSLAQEVSRGDFFDTLIFYGRLTYSPPFTSRTGHPGIKANLKAVQGDLFLLEKSIFFVSKQPVLVELSDVHQAVFSRVGGAGLGASAARTFDLKIVTKSGPEYTFTSLNKEEHEPVDAFLKEKKVRVKNEMMPDGDLLMAGADDDSDEEMQSVASDEREQPNVRRTGDDDSDSEDGTCYVLPSPILPQMMLCVVLLTVTPIR